MLSTRAYTIDFSSLKLHSSFQPTCHNPAFHLEFSQILLTLLFFPYFFCSPNQPHPDHFVPAGFLPSTSHQIFAASPKDWSGVSTILITELENMSYEERLRTLGMSSVEKRRPRSELTVNSLSTTSWGRKTEGGAGLCSWYLMIGCRGAAQSCARWGSHWTLGDISLLWRWQILEQAS